MLLLLLFNLVCGQAHRHDPIAKTLKIKVVEERYKSTTDTTFKEGFEVTRTAVIMCVMQDAMARITGAMAIAACLFEV